MTKKKDLKPLTIDSAPHKVVAKIQELEVELKTLPRGAKGFDIPELYHLRIVIKDELNTLYRLRKKQKNYTPPPKKINLNRGL